jgi:hypothetical protein
LRRIRLHDPAPFEWATPRRTGPTCEKPKSDCERQANQQQPPRQSKAAADDADIGRRRTSEERHRQRRFRDQFQVGVGDFEA